MDPADRPQKSGHSKLTNLTAHNRKTVMLADDCELVTGQSNQVHSFHYFFDPSDLFLGKEGQTRPRKFKPICHLAKADGDIQEITKKRKQCVDLLLHPNIEHFKNSLMNTLINFAEKYNSFESIPLFNNGTFPEIKKNYDAFVLNLKEIEKLVSYPLNLDDLFNFSTMSDDDARVLAVYTSPSKLDKINTALWDLHRAPLAKLLEDLWVTPAFGKEKLTLQAVLVNLTKGYPITKNWLLNDIRSHLSTIIKDDLNEVFNKVMSPMLTIIWNKVNNDITNRNNAKLSLIESFENNCSNHQFSLELELLSNTLMDAKQSISTNCLKTLVKEQRQHSIARFYNLINYYTSFVNTIHSLSKVYQERDGLDAPKDLIINVMKKILQYAHIELDNESTTPAQRNECTVMAQLHREVNIMGFEENSLSQEDLKQKTDILNIFLGTFSDNNQVMDMQRSHTLPFPSCFSWDDKKTAIIVKSYFNQNPKRNPRIFLNKDVFLEIVGNIVDHQLIEKFFEAEFRKLKAQPITHQEFTLRSINLMRNFYIRLFSETELLPDFINKKLDSVSEWRTSQNTYKLELATSLIKMIEANKYMKKDDTIVYLKPYLKKTIENLNQVKSEMIEDTKVENLSVNELMNLVCLYQIEEGMRISLHGNSEPILIKEIFENSIIS